MTHNKKNNLASRIGLLASMITIVSFLVFGCEGILYKSQSKPLIEDAKELISQLEDREISHFTPAVQEHIEILSKEILRAQHKLKLEPLEDAIQKAKLDLDYIIKNQ